MIPICHPGLPQSVFIFLDTTPKDLRGAGVRILTIAIKSVRMRLICGQRNAAETELRSGYHDEIGRFAVPGALVS
jgi:hypothetical protein